MGDVSPRGYYARVNLDAFLRSDTMTRYQAYEVGLRVGALGAEDIPLLEAGLPVSPRQAGATPVTPANQLPVAASAPKAATVPRPSPSPIPGRRGRRTMASGATTFPKVRSRRRSPRISPPAA